MGYKKCEQHGLHKVNGMMCGYRLHNQVFKFQASQRKDFSISVGQFSNLSFFYVLSCLTGWGWHLGFPEWAWEKKKLSFCGVSCAAAEHSWRPRGMCTVGGGEWYNWWTVTTSKLIMYMQSSVAPSQLPSYSTLTGYNLL